jgi:MFS family permease
MLDRYGLPATFRILGYITAGLLTPSYFTFLSAKNEFVGSRGGPDNKSTQTKLMDFRLLRDNRFVVILVASTIAMTGFLPRYFLITPSAAAQGINTTYAAWLLGLMNGLSIIGRLGIGFFADRYGKLAALISSYVLCGAGHLAFWLPAVTVHGSDGCALALITTFAVFSGLFGSGFVSLIPVVIADIFGTEELASKVGLLNSAIGLGALAGPSAANAVAAGGQHWHLAALLPGLLMMIGGLMLGRVFKYL